MIQCRDGIRILFSSSRTRAFIRVAHGPDFAGTIGLMVGELSSSPSAPCSVHYRRKALRRLSGCAPETGAQRENHDGGKEPPQPALAHKLDHDQSSGNGGGYGPVVSDNEVIP